MARSPSKSAKPVHTPGVSDMSGTFVHDAPPKGAKMPMFAPVTGPRLTPEEAPGIDAGWTPHRPSRPDKRVKTPFRMVAPFGGASCTKVPDMSDTPGVWTGLADFEGERAMNAK